MGRKKLNKLELVRTWAFRKSKINIYVCLFCFLFLHFVIVSKLSSPTCCVGNFFQLTIVCSNTLRRYIALVIHTYYEGLGLAWETPIHLWPIIVEYNTPFVFLTDVYRPCEYVCASFQKPKQEISLFFSLSLFFLICSISKLEKSSTKLHTKMG